MSIELFSAFFVAALALAFSPGPGMLYVLSRAIAGGTTAGVASTLGTAVGGFIHVIIAAAGLSAVLIAFPATFIIIKYVGAAFLAYLGLRMFISAKKKTGKDAQIDVKIGGVKTTNAFRQGIVAEILNPKVALFFLTFIPQFINRDSDYVLPQFVALGVIVVGLNMVPDFIISFFAPQIARVWKSSYRFRVGQKLISGAILLLLAGYLAISGGHM